MSTEATAAYVEEFIPEDEPLLSARRSAAQVGAATPVSPAVGATLRFIAAAPASPGGTAVVFAAPASLTSCSSAPLPAHQTAVACAPNPIMSLRQDERASRPRWFPSHGP